MFITVVIILLLTRKHRKGARNGLNSLLRCRAVMRLSSLDYAVSVRVTVSRMEKVVVVAAVVVGEIS
jgi:putative exporter of polyketide antibiotics